MDEDMLLTDEDLDELEKEITLGLKGVNPILNRLIEMQAAKTARIKDAECQERIKRIFEEAEEILFNLSGDGNLLLVNNPVYDREVRKWQALKNKHLTNPTI